MQARLLPARHGALWLVAGFRLFRANPPLLTAMTLGYLSLVIVINLLPLIGPLLVPVLLPLLTVIVANGCRAIESGRVPVFAALTAGLNQQRVPLIRLGCLHLAGTMAILLVNLAIDGGEMFSELPQGTLDDTEMATLLLRVLAIASPVMMAFWFAPLLTGWDGVAPLKSLFFSAVASFRNWRAFLVYGLTVASVGVVLPGLLLVVAGTIDAALVSMFSVALRMLLVFLLAPALTASIYVSYRDVFAAPPVVEVDAVAEPAEAVDE
jgi:hypothetical protein